MNKLIVLQTLLILGRNPTISIAEIWARFPSAKICAREKEFAVFENISTPDLKKIGGVVKTGKVFSQCFQPSLKEKDLQVIYAFLEKEFSQKSGKQIFAFSVYPFDLRILKTLLIGSKKFLKKKKISSRFANKNFSNLTNAQSEFEVLKKGGVEILVAKGKQGWFFAKLEQNQPFESYKKRDYEKAFRDARVGMLPPKLAQIMVNLGVGDAATSCLGNPRVYDPFCGAGGVLVEAALMGYEALGSDIDPRMVDFSQKNLAALNLQGEVFSHDAKQKISQKYDVVVSEGYLGPPRRTIPDPQVCVKIFKELQQLYESFFAWVECRRVVICFPVYLEGGKPKHFASEEILPALAKLGWKMKNTEKLIYSRENQTVGREIVILSR